MTDTPPRVSVVIGVYNCGPYLDETVRSIVDQTFADWELILVDDGSTDETPEVIARWARVDPRIRGVRQPNSGRPAPARNTGIAEARGTIVAFLDGDDLYHPEKLAAVVRVFDRYPDVGAVFHEYLCFADGKDPTGGTPYLRQDRFFERARQVLIETPDNGETVYLGTPDLIKFMSTESVGVHTSGIAVRRPVLAALPQPPFNEQLPHGEDIQLWLDIARTTRMAGIARPLSFYRIRAQSWMTGNSRRKLALGSYLVKSDMLRKLEAQLTPQELPAYRERMAWYWNGIAYDCLVAGILPEARRGYFNGLRLGRSRRNRLRAAKGLVTSVIPRALLRTWWRIRKDGEFAARRPVAQ